MKPGDRRDELRRRVLREWRGCDEAVRSTANVRPAGDFLAAILAQTDTADGIDEERLRQAWRSLAGDLVASQCEPVGLRRGEVSLRVLQPAMRFHLEQIKPMLLQRLRAELGDGRVRSVRFVLG
jgi:hypothetical protein